MSTFKLIHGSCAGQNADAVVNAANSGLWEGSGICGVIFSKCGSNELAQECSKFQTPIEDGNAVITSACKMKSILFTQSVLISGKHQPLFLNCLMLITIHLYF